MEAYLQYNTTNSVFSVNANQLISLNCWVLHISKNQIQSSSSAELNALICTMFALNALTLSCLAMHVECITTNSPIVAPRALIVTISRRAWVNAALLAGASTSIASISVAPALAAPDSSSADTLKLRQGLGQLTFLLDNWVEATTNCKYAEVNKELLSVENKEELLDAAAKSVLFDKGKTSRTLCKRDAEALRFIMAVGSSKNSKSGPPAMFAQKGMYASVNGASSLSSGPQPLLNADSAIQRGFTRLQDENAQDEYLVAMEAFSAAKSALSAASYASGVADYSSVVSAQDTSGDGEDGGTDTSFLESSRVSAVAAQKALTTIVRLLEANED
jgi:hypothetical protein